MEAEHKFIGREKLSEDFVRLVVSKNTRVICLDGEPGIGVSRFAEFSLRQVEQHQQHTCFLVDCQKIPGNTKEEVETNFKTCFEEDVIQKTVTKSSFIFDSSNRQEMIDDLVKKFAAFLLQNQESHVNLLLDNVDRNSKGIVQSFVINALKSFRTKITNVTFILTSRMKLSFSQFKMESVKIQPFSEDEVRKFFHENFDFSFRDDVFKIVHRWCGGNVTVLSLVGRELRDLEDMSFDQEDLSVVIVQGTSQDALRFVNSESLPDEEKWSQIFYRFFEQLTKRAQDHLQKVAHFASDFTAEDLNKMRPNEPVALTKHRVLVELMRTNAIRHNPTDKTFKVDQLKKHWLDTQETGPDSLDCWLDPSNHGRDEEVQDTKTDPFSESMDDNTQQPLQPNGEADGNLKPGHVTLNELLRQRNVISDPSVADSSNQSTGELKSNSPDIAGTGQLEQPARSERCDNVTLNIVASECSPVASSSSCQPQGGVNLSADPSPKDKLPERFKDLSIKPSNLDNNANGFEGRSVDLEEFNGCADPRSKKHMFSERSVDSFEINELQPTAMPKPFSKSTYIPEQDEPHALNSKVKESASVDSFIQGSSSQHVEQTAPCEHMLLCRQTESPWENVPSANDRIESQTLLKSAHMALMSDQPTEVSDMQGCEPEQFNMNSSETFAMEKKTKDDRGNLQKQEAVDESEWHANIEENHQQDSTQTTGSVTGRNKDGEGNLKGYQDLESGMRHNSSYFDPDTPATVRPPPDHHPFRASNESDEKGTPVTLLPANISSRSDTEVKDATDEASQYQQFLTQGNMPHGAQILQSSRTVYVQPIQCTSGGLTQGCTPHQQYPSFDQSARSYVPPNQLIRPSSGDVLEQPLSSNYDQQQQQHFQPTFPERAVILNSQYYPGSHFPLNTQSHLMRDATWHSQPPPGGEGQTGHRVPVLTHNIQQQSSNQFFSSAMAQPPLLANEYGAYAPDTTQSHPVASFRSHIPAMTPASNPEAPQHRGTSSGASSIRLHPQGPWGLQFRHIASQPLQQPSPSNQSAIPSIHLHAQQQQYYQQQQQWQQQQYYQQQQQGVMTHQQNVPNTRFVRYEAATPLMCAMQPESAGFISHAHQH